MKQVTIEDKTFGIYLSEQAIDIEIQRIAADINVDYSDKQPLFISILNGSFMFTSDLLKKVSVPCQLSFIKFASYDGTNSSGSVKELVGLQEDITNRHVIIIEDIIDTGLTMKSILEQVKAKNPASLKIATLLFKPDSLKEDIQPDYTCFSIPEKFVVGYGLDLNGFGRNLPDIYQLI
jgi:hypoxanthine phosphoribosyltransferase